MVKMLVRHGNSFALILDKPLLDLLKVDPTKPLALSTSDGKTLLVAPASAEETRATRRARMRGRSKRRDR
jgi:antitoxin MazE